MFMRYLGGGIGHLEQFLPINDNSKDAAAHEDSGDTEETDDDNLAGGPESVGCVGDHDDSDDNGDKCAERGEYEDEDTEEDEDAEEDLDPGESEDEEIGNVY